MADDRELFNAALSRAECSAAMHCSCDTIHCLQQHYWDTVLSCRPVLFSSPHLTFPRMPFLLTYWAPWSRVLLEKLAGVQLVKKFPPHFREPEGLSPHSQQSVTSPYLEPDRSSPCPPHPTSWRSILIISSHLRLGRPSDLFPHQNPVHTSPLPNTCYVSRPSHSSRFDLPNNIELGVQIIKLLLCIFLHSPVTSSVLDPNVILSTLLTNTLSLRSSFGVTDQVSHPYKTTFRLNINEFYDLTID